MPGQKYTQADKDLAVQLASEGASFADIVARVGASRGTLRKWFADAGVEPGRKRATKRNVEKERKRGNGRALASSPLANKLEENVRRRVEGRTDLLR